MTKDDVKAELYARGRGICRGTTFAGDLLGQSQEFQFSEHRCRVRLPSAEFETGCHEPVGKNAPIIHFRNGLANDPAPERSFFALDYVIVEVDFKDEVLIPSELLDHDAVRKSPELISRLPHLEKLTVRYEGLLVSAWHHWMKMARWATNQYTIGLPDWTNDGNSDFKMPRIHEKNTGYGIWTSTSITIITDSASIDAKRWEHIGCVLAHQRTPPIWFEYLVEAHQRIANEDFSGCVLSSVIACETLARAAYMRLTGTPANAAAAELVNRIAAQAIIGRWKDLTGLRAEGAVHKIFDIRNGLVHSGRTDCVDARIANETLQSARKFVESGDAWWFAEQGLPNPRKANLE